MSLQELQEEIHRVNLANGWFDPDKERIFPEEIALIHSEISEAFEAYRDWGMEDKTGEPKEEGGLAKPEGVASELADVLVRILDAGTRSSIPGEVIQKMHDDEFENVDEELLEASIKGVKEIPFGSAITFLHRETSRIIEETPMPEQGEIARGLSTLYTTLYLICEAYEFDLIAEVERKVAYNATRGYRHGNKLV